MNRKSSHTDGVRPPAILLGGGIIALSVARSLGRAGIRVYLLDGPSSEAASSRYCTYLPTDNEPGSPGWLRWLLDAGTTSHRGAILIPCSDEGLELIIRHRTALSKHYGFIEIQDDVVAAMLDKSATYTLAAKIGIPAPRVHAVNSVRELRGILQSVTYPCALKPRSSHEFIRHFPALKIFVVHDEKELLDAFTRTQEHHLAMIVTEMIPQNAEGYHSYYTYIDDHGEPLFHFTKMKLRQHPNAFGLGTFHVTDWNSEVADLGLRFFKGAGLRGIGNVEFMRDPRDGRLKLIECNARFTLTNELVRASGIDIARIAYSRAAGLPLPELRDYRRGMYALRPASDILAFLESHRNGTMTLAHWLQTLMHKQRLLVFQWRDPGPALTRFLPFWKKQVRKLAKCLNRSSSRNEYAISPVHSSVRKGTV